MEHFPVDRYARGTYTIEKDFAFLMDPQDPEPEYNPEVYNPQNYSQELGGGYRFVEPRVFQTRPNVYTLKKYPKLDQTMYGEEFEGKIKYVVTREVGEESSDDEESDSEVYYDFDLQQTFGVKKKTPKDQKSPNKSFETETLSEESDDNPFEDSDFDENGEYIHFTSEEEELEDQGIISKFKKLQIRECIRSAQLL